MLTGKVAVESASHQENSVGLIDSQVHETPETASATETSGTEDERSSLVSLLLESGVGLPPDEWRITQANRRKEILDAYFDLIKPVKDGGQGKSRATAVREIGIGRATIWRWENDYKRDGYNGLLPDTANCGRHDTWKKLKFPPELVQKIVDELRGIYADTKSITTALRVYANRDTCPPRLAELILDPNRSSKHALPPALRDVVRTPGPVDDAHRGPRALALNGMSTPRKLDILPGDVFTADDTTPIYAWWIPWRTDKEHPFGVKVLQGQFIPVMDVASQCVISYVIIAREKGSYRASDIWHLFGHTFDTVGLPRIGFQLERGSWEANIIRGQEISYLENEVSYERRVGGLRQLPTNITQWHKDNIAVPLPKTLQTFTSFLPKSRRPSRRASAARWIRDCISSVPRSW